MAIIQNWNCNDYYPKPEIAAFSVFIAYVVDIGVNASESLLIDGDYLIAIVLINTLGADHVYAVYIGTNAPKVAKTFVYVSDNCMAVRIVTFIGFDFYC